MSSNAARASTLTDALRAAIERDRDALRRLVTDDVRTWAPTMSTSSLEELLGELERRDDSFSDVTVEVTPLDVNGDYACAEWTVLMTHSGTLTLADGTAIEPSGERVTLRGITVAEFMGERICSVRQYWDELAVLEQLGLLTTTED